MRAELQELGIEIGHNLDALLDFAQQVHLLRRSADKPVSRSTLVYAALRTESLVQAVLEANGLRIASYEERLSLFTPPVLELRKQPVDFAVDAETTVSALRRYRERWPKRPLDALGLVAVILMGDDLIIERHLRASGLNIQAAWTRLSALVDASPAGDQIRASEAGYIFGGLVQGILDAAGRMMVEKDIRFPPLTSSVVLIAVTQFPSDPLTAPYFLGRYLADHVGGEAQYGVVVDAWLKEYAHGRTTTVVDTFTQPLAAIFEQATHIARVTSGREHIAARHLVGAFLASARRTQGIMGSADFFGELRVDLAALARDLLHWLETNAPPTGGDDLLAWRRLLAIRGESSLPRYDAEQSAGLDWLGIDDHVQAFATMIASENIAPPLAIGLFGDWGSGKSFFMAKLREAVTERARRAQGTEKTPYHGRIVQIEFNAWHYVESNLWASLVENVFSNLRLTTGESKEDIADRRAELAKKIDALIADRAAAEEAVQKAEVARTHAANDLDAKAKLAESNTARLRGIEAVDAWELVQIDEAERKALDVQLHKLGLQAALSSREDVRKTLDDLRATGKRAEITRAWITRQPLGLIILALLIVAAPLLAPYVVRWLQSLGFRDLNGDVAQLLAPISTAVLWLAARLKQANTIFDRIDKAKSKIDARVRDAEERRKWDLNSAKERVQAAVREVEAAKAALQKKEQEVAEARDALIELSRGRRLARFINERAESDDYRRLLGVLATVRHDFSTLSRLMYPEEGEEPDLSPTYHIDRIVLYIDDLDRCQPERVVQVLQAVHLLLAFKLFVVVVGVDARWVMESLRQKHSALLDVRNEDSDVVSYAAKPHDYLEKIFQVPFWLEPLSASTTASYMGQLLTKDIVVETAAPQANGNAGAGASSQSNAGSLPAGASGGPQSIPKKRGAEIDPKILTIDRRELQYMQTNAVSSLVSRSPRTVKRFVNTYRFMRAGIAAEELDEYLNEEATIPRYQSALTLLAIVVGAPDISLELFERLKLEANAQLTLAALADALDREYDENHPDREDWQRVAPALRALGNGEETVELLKPYIDSTARYSFRPPYAQLALKKASPRDPFPIKIVRPDRRG